MKFSCKALCQATLVALGAYALPAKAENNIFNNADNNKQVTMEPGITTTPSDAGGFDPFEGLPVPQCLLTDVCLSVAFDGACDVGTAFCNDPDSDCFDCDLCHEHSYDCGACIGAGCTFCPGDALCRSDPWPQAAFDPFAFKRYTSCPEVEDWKMTCDPVNDDNFFTDPLYDSMDWSYDMINVAEVWKMGYTGRGVIVRINDDGVDASHPEFVNKFDVENSCPTYMPSWNEENFKTNDHGTACASLILAEGNNDECAVGIAPGANASSCVLVGPGGWGNNEIFEALTYKLDSFHISSNSWGPIPCVNIDRLGRRLQSDECMFNPSHFASPCGSCSRGLDAPECEAGIKKYCASYYEIDPVSCGNYLDLFVKCQYSALDPDSDRALQKGVTEGRGGLGTIFVWAAGNELTEGTDVNFDGYQNSRYTLSVGAVGKDRKHTSYSTPGAAVFISAPGGDRESLSNNIVANVGGGCHDITVGTSFATPTVSGVVALVLEANPNLGWRDVQQILALTAQMTDEGDTGWVENSAGIHHSNKYGYGIIDAYAAVSASLEWTNLGPEMQILGESGELNIPIINAANETTTSEITIDEGDGFVVENVAVYIELDHASRGDLLVILTSPSGVASVLAPSRRPENTVLGGNERWKLATVRHRGENPNGNWTLTVVDEHPQKMITDSECVDYDWEIYIVNPEDNKTYAFGCDPLFNDTAIGYCVDGNMLDEAVANEAIDIYRENLTAAEACCGCGGGFNVEVLSSWTIIIHGHKSTGTGAGNGTDTGPSGTTNGTQIEDNVEVGPESPISSVELESSSNGTFADPPISSIESDSAPNDTSTNPPSASQSTQSYIMGMSTSLLMAWFALI